jgi:hypothetical protein
MVVSYLAVADWSDSDEQALNKPTNKAKLTIDAVEFSK